MAPSESRGALFNVITWIALVAMCLATLVKVGTKLVKARLLQQDDYIFLAAMLFATSQGIAASFQVTTGFGQHQADLTSQQIVDLQKGKATYTAQLLYVPALGLSRIAVLQFLILLAPDPSRKRAVIFITGLNTLWILIVLFSVAFQCHVPQTWAVFGDRCFNQTTFWTAFGVIELFMDLVMALLPIYLVLSIQIQSAKKVSVMVAFAARLLTAPIIIARLILLNQTSGSRDRSYDDLYVALLMELHINIALITSCAPFLKIIMQSLQPGWLAGDFRNHPTVSSGYPHGMPGDRSSRQDPTPHAISGSQGWTELHDRRGADTIITTGKTMSSESTEQDEAVEKGLVIKQTKTIAVNYQD